jgi:ketosteroid isomerase-like protein
MRRDVWSALTATLAICTFPVCASGPSASGNGDATLDEIWRVEQAYVERLEAGDVEGLAGFWHADFAGWPSHAAEPLRAAAGQASMRNLLDKFRLESLRIRPLAARAFGDIVLVHYLLEGELEGAGGARAAARYRITHTWVRDGGEWRILGGMSAEFPPDEPTTPPAQP